MILPPNPEEIMSVGWSVLERSAAEVTLGVCVCVDDSQPSYSKSFPSMCYSCNNAGMRLPAAVRVTFVMHCFQALLRTLSLLHRKPDVKQRSHLLK